MLLLAEASEILGFAIIAQRDILLTPLGQTFVDASILARKEIFTAHIRQVPMIRWILNLLAIADDHELEWDVVQSALEPEFLPEDAETQIEIVVNWGRYAELFSYDDDKASIYLETVSRGE